MNIEVKRFSIYREVVITDGNVTMVSGFLDDEERRAMADHFQSAIDELLEDLPEKEAKS